LARVRLNTSGRDRLSFPLFFDPDFEARIEPLSRPDAEAVERDVAERWDGASVSLFEGPYGDYLLSKVGKVFPALSVEVATKE
jgi:isopenicillin N synthase-like dioxygenase